MLQILILIAAVSCFAIGWVVARSGARGPVSRAFVLFAFLTGVWSTANLLSGWIVSVWTLRLTFVAGALIPTAAVAWILFFTHRRVIGRDRLLLAALNVASAVLAIVSLLTPWIATGTIEDVALGPAFPVYTAFLLLGVAATIVMSARHYARSEGLDRLQTRYILLGVSLFGLSAVLVSGILPALGFRDAGRLDSVSSLFFVGFSAYAIVRHRLMDTRVILRLSVIYTSLGIFTLLMYYGVLWIDNHLLGGSYSLGGYLSAVFFVPLFLASFSALSRAIRRIANRYFFASLYDYHAVLDGFAKRVSATIKLDEVLRAVTDTVVGTMHVDDVAVAVRPAGGGGRYTVAARLGWHRLPEHPLIERSLQKRLRDAASALTPEDVAVRGDGRGSEQRADVPALFGHERAAVLIPFIAKDLLVAVLILGRKASRDAFTSQDLSLLQAIANQASVAIENARLYAQVQEFSATLEEKVAAQTRDIAEKNVRLETLLKMKSEFLSIASHQLRTPLTAIRGLLAMQAEGDFDKLPLEELKRQQENMLASANRLSNIVNDLLDAMELEGGVPTMTLVPVDLPALLRAIGAELKPNYDRKGLTFTVETPTPPVPPVTADAKMLREALENLIDNAEKYTNKGGVTVTLSRKNGSAVIAITDTGIGVPKTDLPRLFQKFSRGEKSSYQHTDGSGLGLFIAKSIIENLRGTITVESPGEGKGTTVTVTLPIAQPQPANP